MPRGRLKFKQVTCEHCGGEFTVRSDRRAKFCTPRCSNQAKAGAMHPLYNGGLSRADGSGRWSIMCRDGTQMLFYRGVMAAQLGRLLRSDEIVHHINGDPSDDRVENLMVTTRSAHIEMHRADLRGAVA